MTSDGFLVQPVLTSSWGLGLVTLIVIPSNWLPNVQVCCRNVQLSVCLCFSCHQISWKARPVLSVVLLMFLSQGWGCYMYTVGPQNLVDKPLKDNQCSKEPKQKKKVINWCKPNRLKKTVFFFSWTEEARNPSLVKSGDESKQAKPDLLYARQCASLKMRHAVNVYSPCRNPHKTGFSFVFSQSIQWPVHNHVEVFYEARVTKHGVQNITSKGIVSLHFRGENPP